MSTPNQQQNPYAPPTAVVSDAPQTSGIELAERGTRLGAVLIDGMIGVAVALPAFLSMGLGNLESMEWSAIFGLGGAISVIGVLAWAAYTIYLVHTNGQTIGKKTLGIKVVRSDGSRASLARIFWLRNIVNSLPTVIPFVGNFYNLIDPAFIFGEKRRCVHDLIADTIVIRA